MIDKSRSVNVWDYSIYRHYSKIKKKWDVETTIFEQLN